MTDADKQRERDIIEAWFVCRMNEMLDTMHAKIEGGAGPGSFPAGLASIRRTRTEALAFLETQQQEGP